MSRLGGRLLYQVPLQHCQGDGKGVFNSPDLRLRNARDKGAASCGCDGRTDDVFVCGDGKNAESMASRSRREWTRTGAGVVLGNEV